MPSLREIAHQIQSWIKQGKQPECKGKDGFPVFADDPFRSIQLRLNAYALEIFGRDDFWKLNPRSLAVGKELLNLQASDKAEVLRALLVRVALFAEWQKEEPDSVAGLLRVLHSLRGLPLSELHESDADPGLFRSLLRELLSNKPPLTVHHLTCMVELVPDEADAYWNPLSPERVARALEYNFADSCLPSPLREAVEKWCAWLDQIQRSGPRRLHMRLTKLLGQTEFKSIVAGEAWSNAAVADLEKMPAAERQNWVALLQHCEEAESSKPTQKWLKRAAEWVNAIGSKNFRARVVPWFDLVALPRPVHQERPSRYSPEPDLLIDGKNAVVLKGLAWSCAGHKNPELARALGALAEVCFKKVAWLGPRCPKVGNACLYALSVTSSQDSAAQLSRLDQRVKQPTAKKRIGKSLDKAAALTGVTREDLEESTVPTYGLDAAGALTKSLGRHTAELRITGTTQTSLTWRDKDGKQQKSVPAELKSTDAFKKFKRTIQDIEKMLPPSASALSACCSPSVSGPSPNGASATGIIRSFRTSPAV